MISLIELLEKEKWAVFKANSRFFSVTWHQECLEQAQNELSEYLISYHLEQLSKVQAEFDEATQEVREIRKQIKEHIAMIMAIE